MGWGLVSPDILSLGRAQRRVLRKKTDRPPTCSPPQGLLTWQETQFTGTKHLNLSPNLTHTTQI